MTSLCGLGSAAKVYCCSLWVSYNISLIQELDSVEFSRLLWLHQYLYSFMVTVIKAICLQWDGAWVLRVQEQSSEVSVT